MSCNSNKLILAIILLMFCSLSARRGLTHAFHAWPGSGLHGEEEDGPRLYTPRYSYYRPKRIDGAKYPGIVKVVQANAFKYAFSLPEKDLFNNVPQIDKDGDQSISSAEFQEGFVDLDKWIRANISASSRSGGFFSRLLGGREECKIRKAEYLELGSIAGESVFGIVLGLQCPSAKGVHVMNGLGSLFRESTQGMILNLVLLKKDGTRVTLKDLEAKKEIVLGDI